MSTAFDQVVQMTTMHGPDLLVLSAAYGPERALEMVQGGAGPSEAHEACQQWCRQIGAEMRRRGYEQQVAAAEVERRASDV